MQEYPHLMTNSFTIGTTAQVVSGVAMRTNLFRRSFTVHMSVTVYVFTLVDVYVDLVVFTRIAGTS